MLIGENDKHIPAAQTLLERLEKVLPVKDLIMVIVTTRRRGRLLMSRLRIATNRNNCPISLIPSILVKEKFPLLARPTKRV